MLPHLNAKQWRQDLTLLADGLKREHRNSFHSVSRAAFHAAVRELHGRIPTLANHEVVVELARLVALIGDGHTALRLTAVPGFRRYPLTLYRFSEGLGVWAIADEPAAAGARLLTIDATPAEEAYAALRPLVSRDNEMGVSAAVPELLAIPEVLHAGGVVADPERAALSVRLRGGTTRTLILRPIAQRPERFVDARDGADAPRPLWLRKSAEENWCVHVTESRALYVGYNRVRDGADESLATFFDRVFDHVQRQAIDRLVLDIRRNDGGNNLLNRPLVHHLIRCDRINRWGGLYAIVGRRTFSAAMNLAVDLERHTRVLFVGEPTGASPNHYGENGEIVLPQSGLSVNVAVLWWQYSAPYDDRPWIVPDLPAPLSMADYVANRDPAVETALRHEPDPSQTVEYPDRLTNQLRRDDLR